MKRILRKIKYYHLLTFIGISGYFITDYFDKKRKQQIWKSILEADKKRHIIALLSD